MKRDLKEYIVKLNDRNIQRQRESGFTLYAMGAIIIFCGVFLIDNINIFWKIKDSLDAKIISSFTSNFLFILLLYYLAYKGFKHQIEKTKIFPSQKPLQFDFNDSVIFLSLLLICYFNITSFTTDQSGLLTAFQSIFIFLAIANLLLPVLANRYYSWQLKKKQKSNQSVEEIDFTLFKNEIIGVMSATIIIEALILTLFSIIVLFNTSVTINHEEIGAIVKFITILFSLLYSLKIAMDLSDKIDHNNRMEDFEKEIFFDDLDNDKIIERFEKDFNGVPFTKWINEKHIEIIAFFNTKRREFLAEHVRLQDLKTIDKQRMAFEHSGRLQIIADEQARILNETNDFVQRLRNVFTNLDSFASLDDEELNKLQYVQSILSQSIISFNNQYNSLSSEIGSI